VERATGEPVTARKERNKQLDIANWFYLPSWRRLALGGVEAVPSKRGPWLVLADGTGLGERLAQRLGETGEQVAKVVVGEEFAQREDGVFTLNPGEAGDYARLLDALERQGRAPSTIVHLWGLSGEQAGARDQQLGFFSLLYLGRALGATRPELKREIVVVSSGVQDVTGEEELRPEQATVLGPCKVIPQEYPGLTCRSVDLAPGSWGRDDDASVSQLLKEIVSGSAERVVALRGGRRWVQTYEPWPLAGGAARPRRLRERGVYLISGGLGGIGLEVAESLARDAQARLVLVGRGALPARAEWERRLETSGEGDDTGRRLRRLLALEALGAEVLAVQADAADLEQMRRVVSQAETRFGPLHGVIHAVGVERAFQSIAETGSAEAEAQFRPRLQAAAVLEQVLEGHPLDFCLLVSSLASVLGGRGSVSYTAAHTFLDAFAARHNRGAGVAWQSVNWDRWNTWRDATEAPAEGEAGFYMTPAEAVEALRRMLNEDPMPVVVSTGELQARLDRWIRLNLPEEPEAAGVSGSTLYARPELAEEYLAPRTEAEKTLAGIWCEALGLEKVGINDDYFELGGDSVLGLKIVAKANEAGLRLTGRQIFEHHTIAELAAALAAAAPAREPSRELPKPAAATTEAPTAFPGARLESKDLEAFLAQLEGRSGPK
jgi:NAD(P)-dependent dehydrogenase (short-subunit alcohol dehydrogenase family)